jgi:hypothetical protein
MSSSVRCLRAGVPVVLLLAGILGLSYPAHATRALIPAPAPLPPFRRAAARCSASRAEHRNGEPQLVTIPLWSGPALTNAGPGRRQLPCSRMICGRDT